MICIVLAAGYATRLYPLTENFPKPLLPVAGKPIINWLLDDIDRREDVTEHVIISNHKFIEHFEKWVDEQHYSKKITLLDDGSVDNDSRLGAVGDIQFAIDELNLKDDLLIIAGDNILDFSFDEFIEFSKDKGSSCVMCHEENELKKQQKTAIITKNIDDLITTYEEKPIEPKGNLAVPPFYYYTYEDVCKIKDALAEGCKADAPGGFAAWLSGKTDVYAWTMSGKRYDIGDMDSYNKAQEIFG